MPGAESQQHQGEDVMTTAETAPHLDGAMPALPSPQANIELAASAPATEMPSIERVSLQLGICVTTDTVCGILLNKFLFSQLLGTSC